MSDLMFELEQAKECRAKLCVIGVGGGGGNAVNTMIASGMDDVNFVVANTDAQVMEKSLASGKIQLGHELTGGLGAGGNPDIGRKAALEDTEKLSQFIDGLDMLFVTAGMGGGTGTGAAPVLARIAKETGILTVGVVTRPFEFEGPRRMAQAEEGIAELKESVNTLITIPNQRLLGMVERTTPIKEAFKKANDVLLQACRGIADLITTPGLINLDFADVRTIMRDMGGMALMGSGTGSGENRAVIAAQNAMCSPLLEEGSIQGARGVLINISGGDDLSLFEVDEACSLIHEMAHEDANIIFGSVIDSSMSDKIRVTVIATGFGVEKMIREVPPIENESTGTDGRKLSVPAYVRAKGNKKDTALSYQLGDDELDVPTFLRKQAD
ncbi:MAG: cell division protein FtsZ [Nitrospinota bacterium]|jgi:cell division protein FtsZ|nr:cell division protein FtsZ [Nitrospinota bacterium]MDP7663465.1 cell division protein FtsZ [Nitrospinota bacterium]